MRFRHLGSAALLCACGAGASGFIRAQTSAKSDIFAPYEGCQLSQGLATVETAPLAAGITTRTVKTLTGSYTVAITDGRRIMFAYPEEDFFANVKVEVLPIEGYAESKKALIGDFEQILASGDNSRNYKLKPVLNGFEVQGIGPLETRGWGIRNLFIVQRPE